MTTQKTVFISGASSGIGQATAHLLAQRGYRVFGTSRRPFDRPPGAGIETMALDVRSDASVAECVAAVLARTGRIDVLINNAGYELGGAIEEVSIAEAHEQFDTNVYGVMRLTKAILPIMRRQGGGRIINMSSLAGIAPLPFLGIYAASKFAVEGYSEVLRHEVKPFNISVSLVEPSFIKTPLASNRQHASAHIGEYDTWRERALAAIRKYEQTAPEAETVAARILRIIESRSPKLHYTATPDATLVSRLRRFLPESVYERATRRHFQLDTGSVTGSHDAETASHGARDGVRFARRPRPGRR
ncbi:MAG: oxidoreductase [Sulfurifustis sp.]